MLYAAAYHSWKFSSSSQIWPWPFNIVVFIVSECVSGTSRKQRCILDHNNISDWFSQSAALVPKSSIRDCHRLGKYSSSTRPRLIHVNCSSCNVVMEILSSRASFALYFVKPNQRGEEKILLKERWILSGKICHQYQRQCYSHQRFTSCTCKFDFCSSYIRLLLLIDSQRVINLLTFVPVSGTVVVS